MDNKQAQSERTMGLFSAASIGVGAMIGAGIFALIGVAVDITGKLAYISFIIAGVVALLTSYSVSKLAVQFPSKGGPVEYLNKGFGRGLFSGSMNIVMLIGYLIVTSLYARTFGDYAIAMMDLPHDSIWLHVLITGIIVLFVLINFMGAKAVGSSELLIVGIKVIVLFVFGVICLATVKTPDLVDMGSTSLNNIFLASGVLFMSYEGFGLVANTAEDIRQPEKTLPKALVLSVVVAMAIYVLVSIAVIGNLSIDQIIEAKEYALAEAAKPVMGSAGFIFMGIAALFSTSSAINATIYGPVHMIQETAQAKQLPSFFTRSALNHPSGIALLINGFLVVIFANTLNLQAIAETGSLIFLIIYSAVNVANLRLRRQTKSKAWIIWLGIIGTIFCFIMLFYFESLQDSISIKLLLAVFALGILYQWFNQRFIQNESSNENASEG